MRPPRTSVRVKAAAVLVAAGQSYCPAAAAAAAAAASAAAEQPRATHSVTQRTGRAPLAVGRAGSSAGLVAHQPQDLSSHWTTTIQVLAQRTDCFGAAGRGVGTVPAALDFDQHLQGALKLQLSSPACPHPPAAMHSECSASQTMLTVGLGKSRQRLTSVAMEEVCVHARTVARQTPGWH
jgi:hypothetical protein